MAENNQPAEAKGREHFASRIGFILVAAGCAIGLGNVWRFPYITGEYGGGAFVLLYLIFLVILGLPVMVMEFAVGRASQKSCAQAFDILEPKRRFHWFSWWGYIGCMILMMFYTTVAGWMVAYIPKMASGMFNGADAAVTGEAFNAMLANPSELIAWMLVAVLIGFVICAMGLQKGVERITKWMMAILFVAMIALCIRAMTLPGAGEGIAFYLIPDFSRMFEGGWSTFGEAVYAAMGQAFFSLSLGIAAMEIFGSKVGRERSLTGEAVNVTVLNTLVAILAGLIIFPACFAYDVTPDSDPSLVFVTLPVVFGQMPLGNVWGALFFVFMSFAALSTVIAVFENLISFSMDKWGMSRTKAVLVNGALVIALSLPCALGFNLWSGFTVPGIGDIQTLEDFVVSNNMLPLGSLIFVLFCTTRYGWGWDKFLAEADAGQGMKFPAWSRLWVKYGIPVLIIIIFIMGYAPKFAVWFGA
ncbi:sodium-dependent transporter [Slackia equolifaciens]|uniref:Transporter n=1 Tax=Slackia equolifaciens TaxID=498718 RepID=A0A3N0B255_9ACTN|nr:sodium-dependent transporter [Slackia equolifaciens]RNL40970.1 sodium-dependent transporter [Slackia equolifaciens]